ncbi:hypothetical protein FRD01_08975 [Microvenator marinus]|uniref:BIG2 domain-containing protein n=1 Tax=Microvenator marinus TaxID=2600177 RepID=A0A5B8XQV6_9DELT|nr:hypothetical protein [Microvenator marinus]QED27368.1 hypothetical protein FRD01_08975 [Microvenator marinus]
MKDEQQKLGLTLVLLLILATACEKPTAPPEPPAPTAPTAPQKGADIFEWAAGAKMVAAADLNADQKDEWVVATPNELRVVDSAGVVLATTKIQGGPQVLTTVQIDNQDKIVLATGLTVERREAQARVELFELKGGKLVSDTIWEMGPAAQRQEIATVVQRADGRLLIAHYKTRFEVEARTARRAGTQWEFEPLGAFRMAAAWAVGNLNADPIEDVFVGTIYGSAGVEPGGAFQLNPDGTRVPIETVRGVRALEFVEFPNEAPFVAFADGWHQKYRDNAEPRLSVLTSEGSSLSAKPLHVFEDELDFVVWEITPDPKTKSLLARTNTALYRVGINGESTRLASGVEDAALNSDGEILVVGAVPQVLESK